jgi:hypothetical protein
LFSVWYNVTGNSIHRMDIYRKWGKIPKKAHENGKIGLG